MTSVPGPQTLNAETKKNESKFRRRVQDAIQELTDLVTNDVLLQQLPYLDCQSWNEMAEERYLGKICGLPTCPNTVEHIQTHKYHIDRKSNKIYETCTERNKFCSESCFDVSVSIRAQLDAQVLWITGESSNRMNKKYVVDTPKRLIEELPRKSEHKSPARPAKKVSLSPRKVEVVGDTLLANMSDLMIAERDGASSEEEEEPDSVKHLAGMREDSDDENVVKKRQEDEDFKASVSRFVSSLKISDPKKEPISKTSSTKQSNCLPQLKLTETEREKLDRIRNKYSKKAQIKAPIIIEAPALCVKKVKETNNAETVPVREETGNDGEKIAVVKENTPTIIDPSITISPCTSSDTDFVLQLFKQWWTDRSTSFLKTGGLRPTNDIDQMLRRYFAGEKGLDIDLEDVNLPEVDMANVEQKRLTILLQSLKPNWLLMEQKLDVGSSEIRSLSSLLGSFRLTADNIAGFERQQTRLITAILWRIVCRFTDNLEESFFPGGFLSQEICDYLNFCGVEEHVFSRICDEVLQLIQ